MIKVPASPRKPLRLTTTILLFSFSFLLINAFKFSTAISQQFLTSERTTLLKMKQQWGNPTSLSNWNASSSPCNWTEVLCNDNGSVTSLDLMNMGLIGHIPPFICELRSLRDLDLTNNFLTGKFPRVLYNCSNLVEIIIAANLFVGTLPDDIAHRLSRLKYLDVGGNSFTGDIPPAIGNLSDLRYLYLSRNLFSGSIPLEIGNLSNLLTLDLARNSLSGQIPPAISYLHGLLKLDLSQNQLSGEIPPQLSRLRLTTLNLSSNKLTGRIPFAFDNLAFENSFLNNPNLCAKSPISNLHNCYDTSPHSQKFPPKLITMTVVLSACIMLIAVLCTLFVFKQYLKKKHMRDLTARKLVEK